MMAETIDRPQVKEDCRELLRSAQVNPRAFTAFYLGVILILGLLDSITGGEVYHSGPLAIFVSVLTNLMALVLSVGFIFYCMAIRRGERAEFLTLFDGFSLVGKIILLYIVEFFFVLLWSILLLVPGIIAAYRYRFAIYNLCENPGIGLMEAIAMSKQQTLGYKGQLLMLDLSYLGWSILAKLPSLFFYYQALVPALSGSAAPSMLSVPVQTLICGVWLLAVSIFYLPGYQCVELSYFETAMRTSGVGADSGDSGGRPYENGEF